MLINDEHTYNDVMYVIENPSMSVRSKASILRSNYGDMRDYNGAIIGRYANFTKIVQDEMSGVKPLTYAEFKAKYADQIAARKALAYRTLNRVLKPSCAHCGGDYAKGDTHCMHCGNEV